MTDSSLAVESANYRPAVQGARGKVTYPHCMHEDSYLATSPTWSRTWFRYCCWCSLRQQRVNDRQIHGPLFMGDRWVYHWEPASDRGDCPRNAVEGRIISVTTSPTWP